MSLEDTVVDVPVPKTQDGKPIHLPSLFPGHVSLYLTGAGDGTARGNGPLFNIESDLAEDRTLDFSFNDWVYIAGGGILYQGGQPGDWVEFTYHAPATLVIPNALSLGNCRLMGNPPVLIVPAAGNGTHDVNPASAIPVPAFDAMGTPNGFYAWSEPDEGLGLAVEGIPNASPYNLYAAPITLAKFAARLPMLGEGVINLTVPAVKPKKLLPHWLGRVTVHNDGHPGLTVAWFLVTARKKTV